MENVKFTKGDWMLPHFVICDKDRDEHGDKIGCRCGYVLSENFMGAICDVYYADGSNEGDNPPMAEAKANAVLIHAAPDLLRAAYAALQVFESHKCACHPAKEILEAAINKATIIPPLDEYKTKENKDPKESPTPRATDVGHPTPTS